MYFYNAQNNSFWDKNVRSGSFDSRMFFWRYKLKHTLKLIIALFLSFVVTFTFSRTIGPIDSALTSMPLYGLTFLLDAGHGGFDAGASGTRTDVPEAPLNLAITRFLKKELEMRGATVVLTRCDNEALASTKKEDMDIRRQIAHRVGYAAVLSIHMNKFTDYKPNGPTVFSDDTDADVALAKKIQSALDTALARKAREAKVSDFFLFDCTDAPCVLIECGFLSNADDERLLQQEPHQKAIAGAIADGIEAYFDAQKGVPVFIRS